MSASFEEILKRPASSFKAPPAFPVGTYHCIVDGVPDFGKSSQKGTPYVRFKYKIMAPFKGVDEKAAAELQVVGKTVTDDYYVTEAATWRLTDMLKTIGIEVGEEGDPNGKGLDAAIAEAPNRQLLVTLKHEMSQDGKRPFHTVARVEPVSAT